MRQLPNDALTSWARGLLNLIAMAALIVAAPFALPSAAWAAPAITVTDARVGTHQTKTRIVLDLTGRVSYRVFTLTDPHRVVIDLPEVKWELAPSALGGRTGLVRKLRYGMFKPGNSRFVLECNRSASVDDIFLVEPTGGHGYRLVLDLTVRGQDDSVKTAGTAPRPPAPKPMLNVSFTPPPPKGIAFTAPRPERDEFAPPVPAGLVFAPPPARPRPREDTRIVVIDPGHGGVDPGARGVSRVDEKHVTLAVAREVRRQLERKGGYKVVLTRDRDVYIRLRDRIAIARKLGADLFISVHADSMRDKSVRGASVYTLSERASDAEAAALAEQENKVDLIADMDLSEETPDVANILLDLVQRESMNRSSQFAELLATELARETRLLSNAHRFAGFAVLKAPDIPSVLVELGFLSNPEDARLLRRKDHQKKLAVGIARAVDTYFARVQMAQLQ
jgi:N-acetylmuramoyl-L-alanine amidase